MLVLFYTLFSCHKVQAVNIQSASLIRRDLILSNPTTIAPIQEFSTLKLDLTSVSITLDRQTGQRTLDQDISEFNKIKYDNIETVEFYGFECFRVGFGLPRGPWKELQFFNFAETCV